MPILKLTDYRTLYPWAFCEGAHLNDQCPNSKTTKERKFKAQQNFFVLDN